MTDKQIKQNAGRFASRGRGAFQPQKEYELLVEGYIAGAHSLDAEIKELNGQVTLHKERADYYHDLYLKLRNDNKDLEQALACAEDVVDIQRKELDQLRNPWISVEERLPKGEDNPDEYNAPHRARSSSNVIITDGTIINRGYYSYARMRWEWNEGEIKVTHWMPIPQIEKGE